MVEHPIADMLAQIRNAGEVEKPVVSVPYSNVKFEVAKVLADEGYIAGVEKKGKKANKRIEITIAYDEDGDHLIHEASIISGPARRIYYGVSDITPVKRGRGRLFLSTPEGVLTGEAAREENVGGEALFTIW